jgi:hypothetical protein
MAKGDWMDGSYFTAERFLVFFLNSLWFDARGMAGL